MKTLKEFLLFFYFTAFIYAREAVKKQTTPPPPFTDPSVSFRCFFDAFPYIRMKVEKT